MQCVGQKNCLVGQQNQAHRIGWVRLVKERATRKGELLLHQGEHTHTLQMVKTGTVMLLCTGDDRVERPIGLFGPGQPVGINGVVDQAATVSCRALTAGRVCEVQIAAAREQGLLDVVFMQGLAQSCVQTIAQLAEWARIVRIRGVTGQLATTLLQLASLQRSTLVRLPSHVMLADLLSTTRETIARTLRQIALQQGLVRRDRWHCEIDRNVLLDLSAGLRQAKKAAATHSALATKDP